MLSFQTRLDPKPIDRMLKELGRTSANKVARQSINVAMAPESKLVRAHIIRAAKVPAAALKAKAFKIVKATAKNLAAVVYANVVVLKWPHIKVTALQRGGLKFGNTRLAHAFGIRKGGITVAPITLKSGHQGYFQRRGSSPYPIDELKVDVRKETDSAMTLSADRALLRYLKLFPKVMQKEIDRLAAKANSQTRAAR